MKHKWIWALLLGLILGAAAGVLVSGWGNHAERPKGSALLRVLSFTAVAGNVGSTNWQILEDRVYEPFPALSRSPRIARRIVARAELSGTELERFTAQFQQAATKALEGFGAVIKGQFEQVHDLTKMVDGLPTHSRVDLPRRYYAVGDIHGVADFWSIGDSGHVTVIVSLIEGH